MKKRKLSVHARPSNGPQLGDILYVVREHLSNPQLTAQYLASVTGLELSALRTIFKAGFGVTTQRYIISERLRTARRLLRKTRLEVKEVMYRAGFRDPSYFTRAYKQQYGVPPSGECRPLN